MNKMQLEQLRDRNYVTLSGGEKERVQFARLLTQVWEKPITGCRYLFLDEPLNNLDIRCHQEFLQVARAMLDANMVLVAVLHDVNLALQYADNIFFLKNGKLAVVTAAIIESVFDVKANIIQHPESNNPLGVLDRP